MADEFWEKYRDPRWQRRRLEIMQLAGFRCQECGDDSATLNVHHGYYVRGRDPWDYHDHALKCLCEPCHGRYSEAINSLKDEMSRMTLAQLDQAFSFCFRLNATTDRDQESVCLIYEICNAIPYLPSADLQKLAGYLFGATAVESPPSTNQQFSGPIQFQG